MTYFFLYFPTQQLIVQALVPAMTVGNVIPVGIKALFQAISFSQKDGKLKRVDVLAVRQKY